MDKVALIQKAIEAADQKQSNLPPEAFLIGSFTSDRIRHLLNNLGSLSKNYLEIGVHKGGTFIASNCGNKFETSTAIDNFSEFNDGQDVRQEFINNCKKFNLNYHLINQDCFSLLGTFEKPIDFYLYDGEHSYESQKKGITQFIDLMEDEFILCVDDYDWYNVKNGTQDAFKELGVNIKFQKHLVGPDWWNGMLVALVSKK